MTDQSSKPRRLSRPKIAGIAALAAVAVFVIGYRAWAYNSWMEYKLTCITGQGQILELTHPTTPALQAAIDAHFTYMSSDWTGNDHPFYRDGERFYMRPWYYINSLEFRLNDTRRITDEVLGNGLGDNYCSELYDNRRLFLSNPKYYIDATGYINSRNFIWLLSTIAPRPIRDQ